MGTLLEDSGTFMINIWPIAAWNEKCFQQKLYTKSKHAFYIR